MSDIEREEFEQAVTDRWSDSYSFTRFGDEDYYDEVLEGMWWAWQASRRALEGEAVAIVDRVGIMQRCAPYTNLEEGTKLYTRPASESKGRIEGDKSGYGRIADSSGNKQAVSVPEWIKCSDRLPAEYDGDYEGLVWVNDRDMTLPKYAQSRVHWSRVRGIAGYTHWMPTGFRRPQPPKQEQGHE